MPLRTPLAFPRRRSCAPGEGRAAGAARIASNERGESHKPTNRKGGPKAALARKQDRRAYAALARTLAIVGPRANRPNPPPRADPAGALANLRGRTLSCAPESSAVIFHPRRPFHGGREGPAFGGERGLLGVQSCNLLLRGPIGVHVGSSDLAICGSVRGLPSASLL